MYDYLLPVRHAHPVLCPSWLCVDARVCVHLGCTLVGCARNMQAHYVYARVPTHVHERVRDVICTRARHQIAKHVHTSYGVYPVHYSTAMMHALPRTCWRGNVPFTTRAHFIHSRYFKCVFLCCRRCCCSLGSNACECRPGIGAFVCACAAPQNAC